MIPINVERGDLLKYVGKKNLTDHEHLRYFSMLINLDQFTSDVSYKVSTTGLSSSGAGVNEDYVQWVTFEHMCNTFPIYIFERAEVTEVNGLAYSLKQKFKVLQ